MKTSSNNENNKPTKQDYITYLKKHEQEMTDYVISENPKVTSVQWDWDSVDVGPAGLGQPFDDEMALSINGKFNQIENSRFYMVISLDKNNDLILESMSLDTLYVGGDFYE